LKRDSWRFGFEYTGESNPERNTERLSRITAGHEK